MEIVTDFIFLSSKITVDGDCSHEIKRCLLLGRKTMTNLDRILKSRDITLPTNVDLVKAMAFSVSSMDVRIAGQRPTVLPREHTGHSKHLLPTEEMTLHMDITR